jgi:hypothetical protein
MPEALHGLFPSLATEVELHLSLPVNVAEQSERLTAGPQGRNAVLDRLRC